MIDTGALVSLLDYRYWQKQYAGSPVEIRRCEQKIYTANGGQLEVEGKWEVSCNFDGLALNIDFFGC